MRTREEIIDAITAERERQVGVEGWSTEHDDRHTAGELSQAAAVYAAGEMLKDKMGYNIWPWSYAPKLSKPRLRQLEIAAALIIAEIERLERRAVEGQ